MGYYIRKFSKLVHRNVFINLRLILFFLFRSLLRLLLLLPFDGISSSGLVLKNIYLFLVDPVYHPFVEAEREAFCLLVYDKLPSATSYTHYLQKISFKPIALDSYKAFNLLTLLTCFLISSFCVSLVL